MVSKSNHLLNIKGDERLVFPCDRNRIIQVLVNLVDNAVNYSPKGSAVDVLVEGSGSDIMFQVSDEGIGLSSEDAVEIFKPFPNIHIAGISHGSGLGLNISKGIIELHGGAIWVESKGRGYGSKFIFTIPMTG